MSQNLQWILRIHLPHSGKTLWDTMPCEMITRQATTRRAKIPDGIPDYNYVIAGEAKAKANLPRRKIGILMILTGKFQSLEKRQVTQES
jgi:hypothetical protein